MSGCCCKKGPLAVVAVFAFKIISGMFLAGCVLNMLDHPEFANVSRILAAPGKRYYFGTLLVSFFFVLVYKLFGKALTCQSKIKKGLVYGLAVFALGVVPDQIGHYVYMTLDPVVSLHWTIIGLVLTLAEGVVVASILGDDVETCAIKK